MSPDPKTAKAAKPANPPKSGKSPKPSNSPLEDADFNRIIQEIQAEFGVESVMFLNQDALEVQTVSTGSLGIDQILGCGGLPRGRVIEVYGKEASGKTTIALQAIAAAQRAGLPCGFIDMEHALDAAYATALGVQTKHLYFSQPKNGEDALDLAGKMIEAGVKMIVVDSVSALVPKAELEGNMDANQPAQQARMMSKAMRKLAGPVKREDAILLFINQMREKVGVVYGSPEVTSGGNALKYYCSVRIKVSGTKQIIGPDGSAMGTESKAKVTKNKLAAPMRTAEFRIIYGKGICQATEMLTLGQQYGLVRRSGVWFSLPEDPDSGEPETRIGQGLENARTWLEENPERMEALRDTLTLRMTGKSISEDAEEIG